MLLVLQTNQKHCLSWLTTQDTVLLRHDAVYLQHHFAGCPAKLLICATDLAVRGLILSDAAQGLDEAQTHQLLLENPLSLCLS